VLPTHRLLHELLEQQRETNRLLRRLVQDEEPHPLTPTLITFQETTMLSPVAGNTLVYTGTLAPGGSAFSAGTTFAVVSSDPTVTPTVDVTGLIVTIPLPSTFVDNPSAPFNVVYTASGITPSPSTSPTSITATITPSIPTATPTGITFAQTT
jgi:hypothetical protein